MIGVITNRQSCRLRDGGRPVSVFWGPTLATPYSAASKKVVNVLLSIIFIFDCDPVLSLSASIGLKSIGARQRLKLSAGDDEEEAMRFARNTDYGGRGDSMARGYGSNATHAECQVRLLSALSCAGIVQCAMASCLRSRRSASSAASHRLFALRRVLVTTPDVAHAFSLSGWPHSSACCQLFPRRK